MLTFPLFWRLEAQDQNIRTIGFWQELSSRFAKHCLLPMSSHGRNKEMEWAASSLCLFFSSVQSLSCVQLFAILDCSTPGFLVYHQLPGLSKPIMSIELVMPSTNLTFRHPLLLPPSIFPRIRVVLNKAVLCIRWPKHCSFSFSIRPSREYSKLILDGLVRSPSYPRDSQESFSTSQFKSINSSALSFLYSQTPTSIHDYWKNHSLD